MRGRGQIGNDKLSNEKWLHISQVMRERKIGILAVQEAHMTDEMAANLNTLFQRRLHIVHLQGDNPNAAGVALVINRDITNADQTLASEIIPGRAISITLPWHGEQALTILNVYAPNQPATNEIFWGTLAGHYSDAGCLRPDIMLGDMNLVKDSIDRIPGHVDSAAATTALQNLKRKIKVTDGWRHTNPDEKDFTFQADATGSQSRIDRIYASSTIFENTFEWDITDTAIKTDHRLVLVRIAKPDTPENGPGRWAMPAIVLEDKNFLEAAAAKGRELTIDFTQIENRTKDMNKQILFKNFKTTLKDMGRATAKRLVPKIKRQITSLARDRREALNRPSLSEEDAKHIAGTIGEHIKELEYKRHEKARMTVKITDKIEGEHIGPYLTGLNAFRHPREPLHRLRVPGTNPAEYTTNTKRMTQIARDHHNTLQGEDGPWAPERRNLTIENITGAIQDSDKLQETDAGIIGSRIRPQDVLDSLEKSASAKAPGLDGIPYELWQTLKEHKNLGEDDNTQNDAFDVILTLAEVFNDIEDFGIADNTDFAEGWLCPLYKKKDRTDIANYRPITLLNTDYKIFTKILAMRLAKVAHKMINKAQAGFIPDRSIADQVRLAKLMTDYSEATEENGMIVCLDQEKVYDKIKHDYLWTTLRAYGLPEHFIQIVKSLYRSARTKVMINGELSEDFAVTRGVRQGDPLSCLLFNLAIEPLANTLRLSPRLQGFRLPGSTGKLIATLFADDTTVYLSEFDNNKHLKTELDRWCLASGTRFNITKTEIIPLGTPEYRRELRATRRSVVGGSRLPESIHITAEGEATRSLGGWIGNGIDQTQVWERTLEKIQNSLDRWAKGHPTLHLRAKIIQITVGAMTQYLATVQGMPKSIETRLEKITKDFVWDGGRAPLKLDMLYRPLAEGGLNLLDIKTRNEAIDLRWCRKYLELGGTQPTWTLIADVLFENQIPRAQGLIDREVTINHFLQTWRPTRSSSSKLPKDLARLVLVSRKNNVKLDAMRLPNKAKKALPAWYHMGSEDHPGRIHNRHTSSCLKRMHKAMKVKNMIAITKRLRDNSPGHRHSNISTCTCKYCQRDRRKGCTSPWRCCEAAQGMLGKLRPQYDPTCNPETDNLSLTPARIENNTTARENGDYITFDPSMVKGEDLAANFRVFGRAQDTTCAPAFRRRTHHVIPEEDERIVYTSGASEHVGQENVCAGSGVWFGAEDTDNTAIRVPGDHRTEQSGEVAAVLHAVRSVSYFAPLKIISTSKSVIELLTTGLSDLEITGYVNRSDRDLIRATVATLRERGAVTRLNHTTNEAGNNHARELAKQGAAKPDMGRVNLTIPAKFNLEGAQLSALTQARAYAGIRETKPRPPRMKTDIRLDMTRHAVLAANGTFPTDCAIWAALRSPDIGRTIRNFLWKTTHQVQKIGEFWETVPTMENRAICSTCGDLEDMDHILFDCKAAGCATVWTLT